MTARLQFIRQRPIPVPGQGTHHRVGRVRTRVATEEWTR